jgi:hypothetical protein
LATTAAAIAALVAAGCGDGEAVQSCADLVEANRSGDCEQDGREIALSKLGGAAETDELRVRVEAWEEADEMSTRVGRVQADPDRRLTEETDFRFIFVRAAITNLTDRPQDVGSPHTRTRIALDGRAWPEDGAILDGLARHLAFRRPIQPGKTATALLVYNVPWAFSEKVFHSGRGTLEIADFSAPPIDRAERVAVVRLGRTASEAYARGS